MHMQTHSFDQFQTRIRTQHASVVWTEIKSTHYNLCDPIRGESTAKEVIMLFVGGRVMVFIYDNLLLLENDGL